MALAKTIETAIGVDATYHRIVRVDFDVVKNSVWFVLAGYANQAAREAGKDPLVETPFTMNVPPSTQPEDLGRANFYTVAKADARFADAVDA